MMSFGRRLRSKLLGNLFGLESRKYKDSKINSYYDNKGLSKRDIKKGLHRKNVGGMWEEIGKLQFSFLIEQGLAPDMKFLDLGCGSLRGGIHFINYLEPGNYYGMDVNAPLVEAGYNIELKKAGLTHKLPKTNLILENQFKTSRFGILFDYALAVSVFTHLPLNHIRLCFIELSKSMKSGGKFYATFFECPDRVPIEQKIEHQPGGVVTNIEQDPYHYKRSDFLWCIEGLSWKMQYIGDWNHPRAQKMVCFTKI